MPNLLATHLGLLVCPVCHAPLTLTAGKVDCTGCLRRYPIVDDLPVLIASRATFPDEILQRFAESAHPREA